MPDTDKNFAVNPLFKESASFGYMLAIDKGHLLTVEDMILIHRILIGCAKIIYISHINGAKKRANALSKPSKKDLTSTFSIINLTMTVKGRSKFRPLNLKRKLPDNIKSIQPADLSDILKSLTKINLLTKVEKDARRRGSPSKKNEHSTKELGLPSFYQPSEYIDAMKQLIAKPIARKLIFAFLLESKLLQKWLDFCCLLALYQLKFSDMETVRSIDKAVDVIMEELKYENFRKKIAQLDDRKLREIAHKKAILILQQYKKYDDLFIHLYLLGGIFFYA
jgi:hypothetical protein